ncbi:MAG: outer membrane lipoprotein-sorting protein [Pseudomonadales bacterium]|nr:outer membrane lipoprotein-sorting protein [Pseudomonadales bacterium]
MFQVKLNRVHLLTLLVMSCTAWADDQNSSPEAKGLAISIEADRHDEGVVDSRVNMEMVLKNARGNESRRQLRLCTLEVPEDGDKSITIFDSPKDIRGTGLLTFSQKAGPFVGSEFAFEDLSNQEVKKFTYRYLRDDHCGEQRCFVLERDPIDQILWVYSSGRLDRPRILSII